MSSKNKGGRPRIEFDLTAVEGLGRIGATAAEMAHILPASLSTIQHRMADQSSGFHKAYNKGSSLLKASLRRKQIDLAMSGHAGMLIWLGKQQLGQAEQGNHASIDVIALIRQLKDRGDVERLNRIADGEGEGVVAMELLIQLLANSDPADSK